MKPSVETVWRLTRELNWSAEVGQELNERGRRERSLEERRAHYATIQAL